MTFHFPLKAYTLHTCIISPENVELRLFQLLTLIESPQNTKTTRVATYRQTSCFHSTLCGSPHFWYPPGNDESMQSGYFIFCKTFCIDALIANPF